MSAIFAKKDIFTPETNNNMLCAVDNIKEQICTGRNFATRIFFRGTIACFPASEGSKVAKLGYVWRLVGWIVASGAPNRGDLS